jgi:hypothetical protein
MKRTALAILALFVSPSALSCSSSSSSAPPVPTMSFTSDAYTLQPGEEKYYCYTKTLTEDMVFNGFSPTYGQGTHHILLAQSIAAEQEGFQECDVLFKNTWVPLYVGGKGTTPVDFPQGAGYKLAKGTPVVLQVHLLNAGSAPLTDKTKIDVKTIDPSSSYTPAGIFGMDNRVIQIPPQAASYETDQTCSPDGKTLNVFATFAHMHKLGQHIRVTRNDSDVVYDAKWDFDNQPTMAKTMTVAPTDSLKLTCTYANPTANPVTYGEHTGDEMCAFVFYYTPFDVLDGCIKEK